MTREEIIKYLNIIKAFFLGSEHQPISDAYFALDEAIKALEQEPCEDAISRQAVMEEMEKRHAEGDYITKGFIKSLPPVTPQSKTGHCKNCKYFKYDSVEMVHGLPIIVAHEICKRWGDGCKTREDGYCYMFEPQESEDKE